MEFNTVIIIPVLADGKVDIRVLKYTSGTTQGTLSVSEKNETLGFNKIYTSLYDYVTNQLSIATELRTIIFTPTFVTIRIKNVSISENTFRSQNMQLVKVPFDIISKTFVEEVTQFFKDIQSEISR